MLRQMSSILRNATRKDGEKLNILVGATHEAYETNLSKTFHNFYAIDHPSFKKWNSKFRKTPDNYVLLGNTIPSNLDFDLILSANKFGQFQVFEQLAKQFQLPILSIEHTLPAPWWNEQQLKQCREMRGKYNLFISEYSLDGWKWEDRNDTGIVHHAIDSDFFKPNEDVQRENVCLSIVNDWINRDWCCGFNIWKTIVDKYKIPTRVFGDTPGLSRATNSIEELSNIYQQSRIFLNTSTISPIPTVLLEAMSSGCAIVSTATCMIPEIIKHGENGFISNDVDELGKYCQELMNDEELAKKMGLAARQTILEKFNLEQFLNTWEDAFQRTLNW